jgi:hypothetical protein
MSPPLIGRTFHVSYSVSGATRLMRRPGFSLGSDGQGDAAADARVHYQPKVDSKNVADRKPVTVLPVEIVAQSGAPLPGIKKLEIQVSGDDGKTWHKVVVAPAGKGTYKAIFTTPKNAKTVSLKAHLIDAEGNASHRLGGRRSCGHGVHRRAECRPRITGVLKPPHSCCRQHPVAEHDRSAAVAEVQPQGHAIGVDRPATQRGRLDPGLPCRRSARRRGPANTTAGSVRVGHAAIAGRRTIIPRHPRVPAHARYRNRPADPDPGQPAP